MNNTPWFHLLVSYGSRLHPVCPSDSMLQAVARKHFKIMKSFYSLEVVYNEGLMHTKYLFLESQDG